MHLALLIRSEIFCLILLLFLQIISKRYRKASNDKSFYILLTIALAHMVLNIAASTVVFITDFENTRSISYIVTIAIFVLFYLSVVVFSSEYLRYTLKLINPNDKSILVKSYIVAAVFMIALPFLKIEFEQVGGTYISSGMAPVACSAVAVLDFIYSFGLMILNRKKIKENVMDVLFPISFVAIGLVLVQAFVSELLSTGMAITLVTIGFFFSSENSGSIFQQKNMIDGISKFKTNADFKNDLEQFNQEFAANKTSKFIIARASMDNLMEINSTLGHPYGDECINVVLDSAIASLTNATKVYRTTGAELTAIYRDKNEDVVKSDLATFRTALKIKSTNLKFTPAVSMGYAVSSETHNNLEEVINAADFSLLQNKEDVNSGSDILDVKGVSINITGLDNYMFDAMTILNDEDHPYVLNLKTNVMRITPKWKEEFGIASDIMYDLPTVWINHIHPDDRQGFIDDFTATVVGKQKEHNKKYRSMNKDGVYIKCFCHGAVYKNEDGVQLFAGHMKTYGPVEDINDDSWVR